MKNIINGPRAKIAKILARVSDKKQESNPAQVLRLKEFAEAKGFDNPKVYEIEESSTKEDRQKFQEIISEIKESKEPVALFVDTVDRLQRSFRESVILDDMRKAGKVELYFYRENLIIHKESNSADIIRWDMAVMFARSYVLQLSDNVKRRFEEKRKNGEKTGPAPIGYINIGAKDEKKDIIPDKDKMHYILNAYNLFATRNYSIKTLTTEMIKRGLVGKDGKPIASSMIHRILTDPFYYGEMKSKGEIMPHKYEPIMPKSLFLKVQKVLVERRKNPSKHESKNFAIFKGLKCANCGCTYSPEIKKEKYIYYGCTNYKKICKRVFVREEDLMKPIYEEMKKLQLPQDKIDELVSELKKSNESKSLFHQNATTQLQKQYNSLQAKIDRLFDLYLEGELKVTKKYYDEKLAEYKDKQYYISTQLENYTKADEAYYITASTVLNLARRILDIFESSEVNEKRQLLNYLLQNPSVNEKKLMFTLRNPFNTIVLMNKRPLRLRGQDSNLRPND